MSKKSKLQNFSIEELKAFRQQVLQAESKEDLLSMIDSAIQEKEFALTESMNARVPVDSFNIDPGYIEVLHRNGIKNLAQLRSIPEENLWNLDGMTYGGFEQISWARDFFDMTPLEKMKPAERKDELGVAKVIVRQANKCSRKHGNV